MASYLWTVAIDKGAGWVSVSDVQALSFSYGQRQLTDNWSPPVWIISGRRPDLLGTVKIGDAISVTNTGTNAYQYTVTNFEIHYGIKSSMDTWTIQAEGPFSALARSVVTTSWTGSDSSEDAAYVVSAAGLGAVLNPRPSYGTQGCVTSAQSITNENGLDVFTRIARTAGLPYGAGSTEPVFPYAQCYAKNAVDIYWKNPTEAPVDSTPSYSFTDLASPPSPTSAVYDNLTFGSLSLNYANKVVVTPVGGTPQTVGTGNSAYETTTYSSTNANAAIVANRFFALLDASQQVPTSISFTKEQQTNTATLPNQTAYLNGTKYIELVFRGATFYATILGQDLTATPEQTRITLHLCASENGNFFTLDSASLGVLDQNKLGI